MKGVGNQLGRSVNKHDVQWVVTGSYNLREYSRECLEACDRNADFRLE